MITAKKFAFVTLIIALFLAAGLNHLYSHFHDQHLDLPVELRPYRPVWIEGLNLFLKYIDFSPSLSPDHLLKDLIAAHNQTAIHNETIHFLKDFNFLVKNTDEKADMNLFGRLMTKNFMKQLVNNRLNVLNYVNAYESIKEENIEKPVFIVGLPRTGSTFFHNLMRFDTDTFRVLEMWEISDPIPPTNPDLSQYHPSRFFRILKIRLYTWFMHFVSPDLDLRHGLRAQNAEECTYIYAMEAKSIIYPTLWSVPDYESWLYNQPRSLRLHKLYLQTMQSVNNGKTWLLKSPEHMFSLEEIWKTYPDATVVMLHRDPIGALTSFAALTSNMRGIYSDKIDPQEIGKSALKLVENTLDSMLSAREKNPEAAKNIIDINFADLVKDPMAQVRKIYARIGKELSPKAESQIRGYLNGKTGDGKGKRRTDKLPKYEPEWFGIHLNNFSSDPINRYISAFNLSSKFVHSTRY